MLLRLRKYLFSKIKADVDANFENMSFALNSESNLRNSTYQFYRCMNIISEADRFDQDSLTQRRNFYNLGNLHAKKLSEYFSKSRQTTRFTRSFAFTIVLIFAFIISRVDFYRDEHLGNDG